MIKQRIRTVKPELFNHQVLYDAEIAEGLPLRLAYIGLFTCCDKEGRFAWQLKRLKVGIFPYDDVDIVQVLDAFIKHGFIIKYEHQGQYYGCIPSWSRHQCINNRESESKCPPPPALGSARAKNLGSIQRVETNREEIDAFETEVVDACLTRPLHLSSTRALRSLRRVGKKGREGKGTERKGTEGKGSEEESGKENTIVASRMRPFDDLKRSPPIFQSELSPEPHSMLFASQGGLQDITPLAPSDSRIKFSPQTIAAIVSTSASLPERREPNPSPEVLQTRSPSDYLQNQSLPTPELDAKFMTSSQTPLRELDASSTVLRKHVATQVKSKPGVSHPEPMGLPAAALLEDEWMIHSQIEPTLAFDATPRLLSKSSSREAYTTAQVFEHWKTVMQHPNANLDVKRKALIKKALQCGYSVQQLCEAITGCSYTPHNMGFNDRGQRYDGLHVILRDADQIDRFIHHYHYPPHPLSDAEQRTQSNIQTLQRWANKKMREGKFSGR